MPGYIFSDGLALEIAARLTEFLRKPLRLPKAYSREPSRHVQPLHELSGPYLLPAGIKIIKLYLDFINFLFYSESRLKKGDLYGSVE